MESPSNELELCFHLEKGNLGTSSLVDFWYFRISARALVPGRNLLLRGAWGLPSSSSSLPPPPPPPSPPPPPPRPAGVFPSALCFPFFWLSELFPCPPPVDFLAVCFLFPPASSSLGCCPGCTRKPDSSEELEAGLSCRLLRGARFFWTILSGYRVSETVSNEFVSLLVLHNFFEFCDKLSPDHLLMR